MPSAERPAYGTRPGLVFLGPWSPLWAGSAVHTAARGGAATSQPLCAVFGDLLSNYLVDVPESHIEVDAAVPGTA